MNTTTPHYGNRIAWVRRLRGWTQQDLGERVGGMKQQEISEIEGKRELSDEVLLRLLNQLGVALDMFREMDESAMSTMVFHTQDQSVGHFGFNNTYVANPIDKLIELMDELKKVYQEKEVLHELLLVAEQEKVAFLQNQLDKPQ